MARSDDEAFEELVRRQARAIFADADAVGRESIDGRERDCIVRDREDIYIIEATTSQKLKKVRDDTDKIILLKKNLETTEPYSIIRGIIVTKNEPTAEQLAYVSSTKSPIRLESFHRFSSRLIRGTEYLNLRDNYTFGSVADPKDNKTHLPFNAYIDVPFAILNSKTTINTRDIAYRIKTDVFRAIILGEFGVGKSMALREIYRSLSQSYKEGDISKLPIFLNLREHANHTPAEALRRHAESVGYDRPTDLIRAWRAGHVSLLLDGFDEIGNPGWGQSYKQLRSYRNSSAVILRKFLKESSRDTSIIIAGRDNFFDNEEEMLGAIDPDLQCTIIKVNEFDDKAIASLLRKVGFRGDVPAWLPARPLLVTYFAFRVKDSEEGLDSLATPQRGWDLFIDQICRRESEQYPLIEPYVLREFLERLATRARRSSAGLGSFDPAEISSVFQAVAGFSPDDISQTLLLRLPALKTQDPRTGARSFIDMELAGALMAGDVVRFLVNPYQEELRSEFHNSGPSTLLTFEMVGEKITTGEVPTGSQKSGMIESLKFDLGNLAWDIYFSAYHAGAQLTGPYSFNGLDVGDISIRSGLGNLGQLTLQDCIIQNIYVDDDISGNELPNIRKSLILRVHTSRPTSDFTSAFHHSQVGEYSSFGLTTDKILSLGISLSVRVLLTILKKLFVQAGSGRMRSALIRGLGQEEKPFVEPILRIIMKHNLASRIKLRGSEILMPNRRATFRAISILSDPQRQDPILQECKNL